MHYWNKNTIQKAFLHVRAYLCIDDDFSNWYKFGTGLIRVLKLSGMIQSYYEGTP